MLQLMATRSVYLETDEERAVWERASLELMSEEEDGVVDGRAVWIVSPPPGRDRELSAQRDPGALHHHHVQRDSLGLNCSYLALLNAYVVQFGGGTAAVTFSYTVGIEHLGIFFTPPLYSKQTNRLYFF